MPGLLRQVAPDTARPPDRHAIPVHYEGWTHFQQGRKAIEREFARAPDDFRRRIRWIPLGGEVVIAA